MLKYLQKYFQVIGEQFASNSSWPTSWENNPGSTLKNETYAYYEIIIGISLFFLGGSKKCCQAQICYNGGVGQFV